MLMQLCDECGRPAKSSISLMTGYVYVENECIGQSMDFCERHHPEGTPCQPKNCSRVKFVWPKSEKKGGITRESQIQNHKPRRS